MEEKDKMTQTDASVGLSESGVETPLGDWTPDRDLIRWTLSLSVEDRLAVLQDFVDTFWTPQHG